MYLQPGLYISSTLTNEFDVDCDQLHFVQDVQRATLMFYEAPLP
jgi:hypothetical protein